MKLNLKISILFAFLILSSCSGGKYAATEKIYKRKAKEFAKELRETPVRSQAITKINVPQDKDWVASVNFGIRKPNYVVLHHTAQNSMEQTIKTFHLERVGASSHYVIGRDGKVVQMVNDYLRAHHAGVGKWGNDTDLNSSSIGIELDNNGTTDPWTDVQLHSLVELLTYLKTKYKIPQANFIGHMDLAPSRKIDPSRFPWKLLADQGFGYWYEEDLEDVPLDFNPTMALRIIGYDIKNLDAAIKAFKTHYIQEDTNSATLTDEDLKVMYAIYIKFL